MESARAVLKSAGVERRRVGATMAGAVQVGAINITT